MSMVLRKEDVHLVSVMLDRSIKQRGPASFMQTLTFACYSHC